MKKKYSTVRALLCVCIAVPGLASAQAVPAMKKTATTATAPVVASVTDAAAAVPPVVYQSVFAGTPTGVEMESADWKKANAEVGQFKRGHVDILKWDEAQTKDPMPPKPMVDGAAKPVMAPASPPPAAPGVHKH